MAGGDGGGGGGAGAREGSLASEAIGGDDRSVASSVNSLVVCKLAKPKVFYRFQNFYIISFFFRSFYRLIFPSFFDFFRIFTSRC